MCNLQGLLGKVGDTKDIIKNVDIRFTRNVINNTNEIIQQAIQLSSLVSKETVLENLQGLIPSVDEELQRISDEKEENLSFMQDYSGNDFNNDTEDEADGKEDDSQKEDDK